MPAPLRCSVRVVNRRGLHARAAARFVKLAESFDAEVEVIKDGTVVPGISIMGLMMLAAATGSELLIQAQGREGAAALDALRRLVQDGFGEDQGA